jgi:hypothetical protein
MNSAAATAAAVRAIRSRRLSLASIGVRGRKIDDCRLSIEDWPTENQQSKIVNRKSSIENAQSQIVNRQSSIVNPLGPRGLL